MSDDDLLAAIRAAPDDDAPRLVYADVLSARGDLRGELITVQCELARGDFTRERGLRLRRRETELLASGSAWRRISLPGGDVEGELRRGFIEAVTIDGDRLLAEASDVIREAPLLRDVVVSGLASTSEVEDRGVAAGARELYARIEQIVDLPFVEGFDLDGGTVTWVRETAFAAMQDVSANAGGLVARHLAGQARLRKLRSLSLRDTDRAALEALSRSPWADRIERLVLRGKFREKDGVELPASSTSLRPRKLWLLDDYVSHDVSYWLDVRLRDGHGAAFFERVEDLGIGSARRSLRRAERSLGFAGTGVLPRLKRLRCDTSFTAADLRLLTESEELAGLEELRLQREPAIRGPFDLAPLLGATNLTGLRVLSLGQHVVSASTARQLIRSPLGARLEVLDLRSNADVAPIASELRAEWDGIVLAT